MRKLVVLVVAVLIHSIASAQAVITDVESQNGGFSKVSACVGETVRLTGTNFPASGAIITVNNGPVVSSYAFISSSIIEFIIPWGTPVAGVGVVVTIASIPSNPRVLAIIPQISILSQPLQQVTCEGNLVNFSVNATGGILSYLWKKNGVTTGITTPTIDMTADYLDSGAVYMAEITNLTCGTSLATNAVKLIVYKQPSNPSTLPSQSNCLNGQFTMNAPAPQGTGTWSCNSNCGGIVFANPTSPNAIASGVAAGTTSQLKWTVVNGACTAYSYVSVTNNSMPTTTASIEGAPDTAICINSPTAVNLRGVIPTGNYTNVKWTLQSLTGNFTTPTIPNTSFTQTSGAGLYTVVYNIYNGACSTSTDKKINVYELPVVNAGAAQTACYDAFTSLYGSTANTTSFLWTLSGNHGTLYTPTVINPVYIPAGADSAGVAIAFTLSGSNPGCSTVTSTTTLTIRPKAQASSSMTITASKTKLCYGESATFEIAGVEENTIYKLVKNFNSITLDSISTGSTGATTATITIPYAKFTSGHRDTIRFVARRDGCGLRSYSVTKASIEVSALATPVISVSNQKASCERNIIESTPQANVQYQWYEGNSQLIGAVYEKDTAYYPGIYFVKATDLLSCTMTSNSVEISYNAQQPIVSISENNTSAKLSTSVQATGFNWYAETSSGLKKIAGATTNELSVYFEGTYYLGIVKGSCLHYSAPLVISNKAGGSLLRQSLSETDTTITLPEIDFSSNLKVYPNPVSNSDFTIDYIAGNVTQTTIILYNSNGLEIMRKELDGKGIIRTEMPSKGLPSGIYVLYINDGEIQVRKNIMIN